MRQNTNNKRRDRNRSKPGTKSSGRRSFGGNKRGNQGARDSGRRSFSSSKRGKPGTRSSRRSSFGGNKRGNQGARDSGRRSFSGKKRYTSKGQDKRSEHNPRRKRGNSFGRRGRGGFKREEFNPSQYIQKAVKEVAEKVYVPKHKFNDFDINNSLKENIASLSYKKPTPIQDQIIPKILKGHDVIGIAETGTGKTASILVPLMEKAIRNPKERTLILAPTRELTVQIDKEFKALKKGLKLYSTVCVGGVNIQPQIRQLKHDNHFVIGTPGRVLDLMKKKHIKSEGITNLVFDEADRMLDMGFMPDIRKIVSKIRSNRQTLFFSATMQDSVKKLTQEFLKDPIYISVKKKDIAQNIEQDVIFYTHNKKFETLVDSLNQKGFEKVIVFGAQKHSVKRLAEHLAKEGIRAESIHGNKNSRQRQASLDKFKKGEAQVLVATDVVARGIHVDNVTYVINYDLPSTFEDYVHRIGRTGRMEKKGKALTFVDSKFDRKQ